MDKFRPEYVEALNAARWNYWWYIAVAIPFLLFVPAAVKRKYGCFVFPTAYFSSWLTLNLSVQHYWSAKAANAVTTEEMMDVTADTARALAPLTTVPIVFVYVSVAGALVYAVVGFMRFCLKPKT
ncbi:MAG: hypothetical protein KDA87_13515 [Planctomycetales bacterium]|nr:hypothetical protein [Planctomycetales bacterium]